MEERIDTLARAGSQLRGCVAELEGLATAHPYRERFVAQTDGALYRDGREVEAHRATAVPQRSSPSRRDWSRQRRLDDLDRSIAAGDRATVDQVSVALAATSSARQLGEGAFGTVYQAMQTGLGREVAIKVVGAEMADDVSYIRRFEVEAQLVSRLEHPHIVPLYDYWRRTRRAYPGVSSAAGRSRRTSLTRDGPWLLEVVDRRSARSAVRWRPPISNGVMHRDVKPGNVLFDEDGHAYLGDFGIAILAEAAPSATASAAHELRSPLFRSPEQARDRQATARSDQYSFAATIWELLVGEPPFAAGDDSDRMLVESLLSVRARRPDVPAGVDEVLQRAGNVRADERFASIEDLLDAWGRAIGTATSDVTEPVRVQSVQGSAPVPRARRQRVLRAVEDDRRAGGRRSRQCVRRSRRGVGIGKELPRPCRVGSPAAGRSHRLGGDDDTWGPPHP